MTFAPSPEQQKVIDAWDQGMAVLAGAGSGKTTTLVAKCEALLLRKPEGRFAAVSFTERSASDLRAKLVDRLDLSGEGGALSGHWVMTIHGLCGAIIREFPREAGFDGEESVLSQAEAQILWENAIDVLWSDGLPPAIHSALDALLMIENRDSLFSLLARVRDLYSFGICEKLARLPDPMAGALEKVSQYVLERYDRLKRRRGALDFNDLERGADRALAHESVGEAYRRRFDLVLVDEFQDTNPVQADIIKRLVRGDCTNLCVVGDPKQSIYRFRDADVSVFEKFCGELPVRLSLTWNFRSRPQIIEFVNAVCAKPFETSGVPFEPLIPKIEPQASGEAVIRLNTEVDGSAKTLARWIRSEESRGIPLQDMALLLRKIRGNEALLKALTSAGIPIAVGSGGLFWGDPRVREMVALLKWWDNPKNRFSGAVFLRAPWVGVPDGDLDQWLQGDLFESFFTSELPMARALKPFRDEVARPGQLLLSLLIDSATEDELGAPLLGLWHRVEELSARGLDFHGVVTEISAAAAEERRERDVAPPRNQGQLSVLTLHSSKGLEFPHVILFDLAPRRRGPDMPLLFWDREKGPFLGGRDADGERDKEREAEWRADEKRKDLAESKRLFYVALTRARERLILVCPPGERRKTQKEIKEQLEDPAKVFDADNWQGWIEESGVTLPWEDAPAQASARTQAVPGTARIPLKPRSGTAWVRPRHSVTEWNLFSRCPRAYEWTYLRPVHRRSEPPAHKNSEPPAQPPGRDRAMRRTETRVAESGELTQRELGTRVHACLETGDLDGLKLLETEAGTRRFPSGPLIDWATSSSLMRPRDSQRDVWTELPFEIPVGGEVLVGSMDRVVFENGRFTIVDFKVTATEKSADELISSYRTQLELYAQALQRLDDRATGDRVDAIILHVSPEKVQVIEVPLQGIQSETLAQSAARIVAGGTGEPTPGKLCAVCDFNRVCDRARDSLS